MATFVEEGSIKERNLTPTPNDYRNGNGDGANHLHKVQLACVRANGSIGYVCARFCVCVSQLGGVVNAVVCVWCVWHSLVEW